MSQLLQRNQPTTSWDLIKTWMTEAPEEDHYLDSEGWRYFRVSDTEVWCIEPGPDNYRKLQIYLFTPTLALACNMMFFEEFIDAVYKKRIFVATQKEEERRAALIVEDNIKADPTFNLKIKADPKLCKVPQDRRYAQIKEASVANNMPIIASGFTAIGKERMMLRRCDELSRKIKLFSNMQDGFDPLYEYRLWWEDQGISSETEDGYPEEFCFYQENVEKFADYWNGVPNQTEDDGESAGRPAEINKEPKADENSKPASKLLPDVIEFAEMIGANIDQIWGDSWKTVHVSKVLGWLEEACEQLKYPRDDEDLLKHCITIGRRSMLLYHRLKEK